MGKSTGNNLEEPFMGPGVVLELGGDQSCKPSGQSCPCREQWLGWSLKFGRFLMTSCSAENGR
eukprot:6008195-Ditylum_brightwellii.AAC.1